MAENKVLKKGYANMKVSVVIPVRNNQEMIEECIESLLDQDFPRDEFEIIVVDNNSTDDTSNSIKKYPVIYIFEEKIGRAHARNTGIKNARGEIIAFTDSDCVADMSWLKELIKGFSSGDIGGVGGEILGYKASSLVEEYSNAVKILSQKWAIKIKNSEPGFIQMANAAYLRNILFEVGLLDETFPAGEDTDLAWRVQWAGYKIKLMPQVKVFHKHKSTVSALFRQFFGYGLVRALLLKKHKKMLNRKWMINFRAYIALFYHIIMILPALILGKTKVEKTMPILDIVKVSGLILGGFYGSIRNREIAF